MTDEERIARCRHEIIDLKEKTRYPESEDEDEDVDMWTEQNRRDRDTQIRKLEQELEQKQYQDERLEAELLSEEEYYCLRLGNYPADFTQAVEEEREKLRRNPISALYSMRPRSLPRRAV
jgi:predicted RNase H-like nuclease (RuvC/YqgF family)